MCQAWKREGVTLTDDANELNLDPHMFYFLSFGYINKYSPPHRFLFLKDAHCLILSIRPFHPPLRASVLIRKRNPCACGFSKPEETLTKLQQVLAAHCRCAYHVESAGGFAIKLSRSGTLIFCIFICGSSFVSKASVRPAMFVNHINRAVANCVKHTSVKRAFHAPVAVSLQVPLGRSMPPAYVPEGLYRRCRAKRG